jgi:prefoldin subunit 5
MSETQSSETKPKKMVRRSVAIALGIICVVVVAGLAGTFAYYVNDKNNTISSLDSQISNLQNQISSLQNQKNTLQTWLDGNETLLNQTKTWLEGTIYYSSQISTLNTQIASLQNQISQLSGLATNFQSQLANLQEPKLVEVNLVAEDNRTNPSAPYLHVQEYVFNVGKYTAEFWFLRIVAYQSGGATAINTDINLPSIDGESWTSVDSSLYYNGSALTSWNITLVPPMPI